MDIYFLDYYCAQLFHVDTIPSNVYVTLLQSLRSILQMDIRIHLYL